MNDMKIATYLTIVFLSVCAGNAVYGQVNDSFNGARQSVGNGKSSAFNNSRVSNFNDYRQKLNAEYERITREPWNSFNGFRGIPVPDEDVAPVPPVIMSDEDAKRDRQERAVTIDEVIKPIRNNNRTQPIFTIEEQSNVNTESVAFTYLGTKMSVRVPGGARLRLRGTGENDVADAWNTLCGAAYNNTIIDCVKLRSEYKLCDWAYLKMLQTFSEAYMGSNTNEAVLMAAFIYSQSGYKARLGEGNGRLEMLYASQHEIYGRPYFECDGDKFFTLSGRVGSIRISAAKYPREQSMSLWVNATPDIAVAPSATRTLTSKRYPEMSVQVSINKNLLDFFDSYPSSEVGGNFMTRWAMYANTPLCGQSRQELYAALKGHIAGMSQLNAVERLLNWVQTAFVYEYDDKVWGHDRAFFADETLYYPYCDCEDRSILFTRIVRDLLGLQCVLVYYPGHLAAGVCFTENVNGDYIIVNGKRFVITDPTYIGASVGATMPNMSNASAKAILLE